MSAVLKEPYLAISVVDQGQGIAADQLPHLFKKFSRVGGSDGQTRDTAWALPSAGAS